MEGASVDGRNTSVLIVMAHVEAAERLAAPLRSRGYRVASLPAWDGAVEVLGHLRFDLAIVDSAALAASAPLYRELAGQTPVVLVTDDPTSLHPQASQLGVRATLDVAADPDAIVSAARRALGTPT